MELNDLVGKHILTGVDESHESVEKYGEMEDCNIINFVLDGKTYTAVEDPSDGYRSSLGELEVSDFKVTNLFPGVDVLAVMDTNDSEDVLHLYDEKNGKVVLSVGTSNSDDYYPSFVASFMPENMSSNEKGN